MGFVAVDLGASNTRYITGAAKVGIVANNMVWWHDSKLEDLNLDGRDKNLANNLEVIIEREGDNVADSPITFPVHALVGAIANRYSNNNTRPSGMTHKYKQEINYISALLACGLSRLNNCVDENVVLHLALPPVETNIAKDKVKSYLVGKYKITFPRVNNGVSFIVNILDTVCHEESFMAITSYLFNPSGSAKPETEKYLTGQILSLDIGASTTDITLIKDGKYMERTGQTYKIGGNLARDLLVEQVAERYEFELPVDAAETTMYEGRLQLGNQYIDIPDMIANSKQGFANRVVENMQGYFKKVNIPIQSIRAIIVSGGGSMQSQYDEGNGTMKKVSEPMSYYIVEKLKKICPTIEVEPYGDNPRLANIIGLFIMATFDEQKRRRKKERENAASQFNGQTVQQTQVVTNEVEDTQSITHEAQVQSANNTSTQAEAVVSSQDTDMQDIGGFDILSN